MSELKSIFSDLADVLLEINKENYDDPSTSFEAYKEDLKKQCVDEVEEQIEKIQRGYRLIIDELDAEERKKSNFITPFGG